MKAMLSVAGVIVAAAVIWYVSSSGNGGMPVPTLSPVVSPAVSPTRSAAPSVTPTPRVTATTTSKPTSTPTATVSAGSFTAAQVATHNSRTSCFSIIRGSVYDLTSYIDKHPGGPQKILGICGADGSSLFVNKHGGSEKQEAMLATLKIGELVP